MSNENYILFVYGSLRSGFRNPVYAYLTKFFHLMGEAVVKGKLYDLGDFPAAAATNEEKFISGELYCINNPLEFTWAIGQLDDYEGLNTEADEIPLYKREEVIAYANGKEYKAWIYWYNHDLTGKKTIESGDLLQYLQQKNKH